MILFSYVKAKTHFIFLAFKNSHLEKKDLKSFLSIKGYLLSPNFLCYLHYAIQSIYDGPNFYATSFTNLK